MQHAGQTVSKEDLLSQVWEGAAVEENNLTQSISTLRKVLGEKRGENRYIVTDSGRGYRFVGVVSRVLDQAPVAPDAAIESPPAIHATRNFRNFKVLALASAIALLGIALGGWLWMRTAVHFPSRRSVAVVRIRDLSKTTTEAWLQTALTEMLTSEVAAGGRLRAIPPEDVARWRADFGSQAEAGGQANLVRSAHRNLGAETLVLGSYVVTGTCPECRVRVDLALSSAMTGERFATIIDEGAATDLLDLTSRLGRQLRAELGLKADAPTSPRWPAASAMREYTEGLRALRQGDPMPARDHLQAAETADRGNALIHSALADAWTALGYGTRANEEYRRAYELSGSLDRLDQLGIEARYRASLQQWDRAIEIYTTIFQLFPDSLDDGLNLARSQWRGMKLEAARSTLTTLRRLPKPVGGDPRIDFMEAQIAGILNDYAGTRQLAHQAAEEAKTRGARYLFARARLLEGGAMQSMNDRNAAGVQDQARAVCEDIGDRDCLSKAWRIRGNNRFDQGDFPAAQQAYMQGIAIARELGNRGELANLLVGLGVVAKANRDWRQAEQHLLEAVSLRIETGYNPNEVRNVLAELYLSIGRLADAERVIEAAGATARKIGAHGDLGEILALQAALARLKGDLNRAQQLTENAVAELRRTRNPVVLSMALAQLSSVRTARGDLLRAEKDLTAAGPGDGPEIQGTVALARAELSIAKGQFQDAVKASEQAAAAFDNAHLDERSALAFVTAADAMGMSSRDEAAFAACREGQMRASRTPNRLPIAFAELCAWKVSRAPGNGMPGELQAMIANLHNPELRLTADYARAERAKRAGDVRYRRLFADLAEAAAKQGYITLSRRAAAMAQSKDQQTSAPVANAR